jgi:hypothetical protein
VGVGFLSALKGSIWWADRDWVLALGRSGFGLAAALAEAAELSPGHSPVLQDARETRGTAQE